MVGDYVGISGVVLSLSSFRFVFVNMMHGSDKTIPVSCLPTVGKYFYTVPKHTVLVRRKGQKSVKLVVSEASL